MSAILNLEKINLASYTMKTLPLNLLALWTVLFINGLLHPLSSLVSASYSPGTISGVFLYVPLGFLALKRIILELSVGQRNTGITAGILIHLVVVVLALTI